MWVKSSSGRATTTKKERKRRVFVCAIHLDRTVVIALAWADLQIVITLHMRQRKKNVQFIKRRKKKRHNELQRTDSNIKLFIVKQMCYFITHRHNQLCCASVSVIFITSRINRQVSRANSTHTFARKHLTESSHCRCEINLNVETFMRLNARQKRANFRRQRRNLIEFNGWQYYMLALFLLTRSHSFVALFPSIIHSNAVISFQALPNLPYSNELIKNEVSW